ncbi:MAG: type III pantothenate kinase [Bacteroidales bacterium]|jgi:type III pantothenate kinase|nr:type III pantothenate kinase [Bacteroidales bacterium]
MNLVIDLGNSFGKIAVCEGSEIIESAIFEKISNKEIAYFITCYKDIKGAIFSSVTNHSRELIDYLDSSFDFFLELSNSTPLPLVNHYKTPETLGHDRIAAVTGAHTIFPERNVLVIDAGTAITFDMITSAGEYIGGNISPGLAMRFKALHRFTSTLPHLEADEDEIKQLGKTTDEAIISGVMNGIVYEIEGYINGFSNQYKNLQVVLTGGDANSFDKKLKNSIFVVSHLNLIGLNRILDYNAQQKKTN